jgi:uncharacterized protein YgbK (DUF1537 family)
VIVLGAIADDFTGATDLAGILARDGRRVLLAIGVPETPLPEADAVVVALKSRTIPAPEAVRMSLEALKWLKAQGAGQILFKYCSTFDSTAEGNIGPVADALGDALGAGPTIVCPAFPANGRTIYQGHLFVGDKLLQDSSMKDHPLTPMRRSNLVALMAWQSRYKVGLVPHAVVAKGADAIRAALAQAEQDSVRYLVTDAITDADLMAIGNAARDCRLVTGGSAVAIGLVTERSANARATSVAASPSGGRVVILAGSCSSATREQLLQAIAVWPHHKLDLDRIAAGAPVVGEAADWLRTQSTEVPAVVYSSADPTEVGANQARYGRERAGEMMEQAFSGLVHEAVADGVSRLIVAGGETSGAVVSALGITALEIGSEIALGVPWTRTIGGPALEIALKSGNFGGPDFFERALATPF